MPTDGSKEFDQTNWRGSKPCQEIAEIVPSDIKIGHLFDKLIVGGGSRISLVQFLVLTYAKELSPFYGIEKSEKAGCESQGFL